MQNFLKRFSVVAGFAVLVLVVIAATMVTRNRLGVQLANGIWVRHTREVLLALEHTQSLLKDAETGQRGFLYTGDPRYLAPYSAALAQVDPHLADIARLTADSSEQQVSSFRLRSLAHEKLAELAETIDLYRSGKLDAAKTVVLSDRGLRLMNEIRDTVSQMESREYALQASRAAEYAHSVQVTIATIYGACAVGVMGLVGLAYFILGEMRLRERHGEEIRAREERFRVTLTSIGDGVIATDREGRVTFLNPIAEKLTGVAAASAMGRAVQEVFPIFNEFTGLKTENPVEMVIQKGHIVGLANHTVLRHADGHLTPIEDSAAPICDDAKNLIGVVLVFRDVTSERKAQELLRRSEKLSAAARLSATVAHEINNPLEAVGNLIYIAKLNPGTPDAAKEQLEMAEHELDRVAHITRQTLGFYRESNDPQPMDVTPMMDSVLSLYSNKLKTKNVSIRRHFGECPPVIGIPGELRQVFSNLVSNAVDAVEQNGTIDLSVRCVRQMDQNVIQVLIEDDGPGVPQENLVRIFEPFFTTKKDIGTGLGLWVTREIVERHGGSISVQPRHDKSTGACFAVELPCDPDPHAAESVLHSV